MAEDDKGPSALSLLKWPLGALFLGLVASALLVGGSFTYLRHEQNDEKASQRALNEAQGRIGNANKEVQDLLASVDIYKKMRDRGLFGEESRLRWVEQVAALKARHKIVELEYDLGSRQPAVLAAGMSFPSIEILGSRVQMKMLAYHDADLVGFINELPTLAQGAFPMDRCAMKLQPEVKDQPLTPRVEGQCSFVWVTLVDKRPTTPVAVASQDSQTARKP